MIALLQRVSQASVHVNGEIIASIGVGTLALIGVERGDAESEADRLLDRIIAYRMFADERGRMNLDLRQSGGSLLLVPQFTLAANTDSGNRPSFTPAAPPEEGSRLFNHLKRQAAGRDLPVANGIFGAYMQVRLINDGPVTFRLRVRPARF